MLIKNGIDSQIVPEFSFINSDIECLTLKSRNYVYSVIYTPPDSSVNNFTSVLEKLFNYVNDNNLRLIVGGDININILESSPLVIEFMATVVSNGYEIVTDTPTRITPNSATLIDVFITNINKDNVESGVLCCDMSDHLALYFITDSDTKKPTELPTRTVQDITPLTLAAFSTSLSQTDWSTVYLSLTADLAYETFIAILKQIYLKHFKEKVVKKCRKNRKPWINNECLKMIKKKTKLFRRFLKTRDLSDLKTFKEFRNKVNAFIRKEKRDYLSQQFNPDCCNESANIWRKLNTLLHRTPICSGITEIKIDGQIVKDLELAEKFNHFLINVVQPTQKLQPTVTCAETTETNSIFFGPTDDQEIALTFSALKNTSVRDIDSFRYLRSSM